MVRVQLVYWGDFVDLSTYSTLKCMCFQAVKVPEAPCNPPPPPLQSPEVRQNMDP